MAFGGKVLGPREPFAPVRLQQPQNIQTSPAWSISGSVQNAFPSVPGEFRWRDDHFDKFTGLLDLWYGKAKATQRPAEVS